MSELKQKFKERDQSKAAEQQGIFRKFSVQRVDGSDVVGGKHFGCRYFVLDMDHDVHAPAALRAYAESCRATHPELAADLDREFGRSQPEANADAKDAERYRWLRDKSSADTATDGFWVDCRYVVAIDDDAIDAAIQAASKTDAPQAKGSEANDEP